MPGNDILIILKWWIVLFCIGLSCLPLTFKIFSNFIDRGYIFSKILGIGVLSYIVFILGTFHILPFSGISVILVLAFIFAINLFFIKEFKETFKKVSKIVIFEEIIFLAAIFLWSYVRGTSPDIHGLEKFMDYGFINSILRSSYFPPKDMWFTPHSINYYYFGHLVIAVLTNLSDIKSSIVFNLSVASIFAFTFVGSFSIGANLFTQLKKKGAIVAGIVTAIFVSFGGNLQTIYSFFVSYTGDSAPPFWQLIFSPYTFPNSYWYPNATRFIYHTIHEFPIYSFVVSDLHAHVLSLPFVITIIAVLLSLFLKSQIGNWKLLASLSRSGEIGNLLTISFLLSVLYMTNTWDTVTYFLLTTFVIFFIQFKNKSLLSSSLYLLAICFFTFIFILPFSIHFKPFAQGIGLICPPQFLIAFGKIGPFIFEANHCQHSPFWQLLILYGFFFFWIASFMLFIKKKGKKILNNADIFVILLIIVSILLIIFPEFFYIKDIYPGHYRANTMFKFTYQAFIMLQICSAYIAIRIFSAIKSDKNISLQALIISTIGIALSFLVFSYPVFAVNSYYNGLKVYSGLDGGKYLQTLHPDDYKAINWLNKNIKGQPVIAEAQGDSYTDFARISANTGLPTILGWTVHEWLWRGSYDKIAPRITDIKAIYQTPDITTAKKLLKKYDVSYVYIGDMERQKYPNLNEDKFRQLGTVIFQTGNTRIYKIN